MLDLTCTLQHQGAGRDGIAQWDTVRVFACRGGRAWATGGAVGIDTCAVTQKWLFNRESLKGMPSLLD